MRINFLGGSNNGRATILDTQRTINFYPEIDNGEMRLIGTPGLKIALDTSRDDSVKKWQDNYGIGIIYQDNYDDFTKYQNSTE